MPITVLIVEDDKAFLQLLQTDLELQGYTVATAEDGLVGLKKFNEVMPDLLVLDVSLPSMDGLTICQRVREISDVPILMMTATQVTENEIAHGLNIGADEFMLKPLPVVEFHARVKALLRRARVVEAQTRSTQAQYQDDYRG
jgi:DNA-binding response OmpR family regulator